MKYEVTVGNIGVVHCGNNYAKALASFREYRLQSLRGYGRAAGESVTLWNDTEPDMEFDTSRSNVVFSRSAELVGYRTGYTRPCRLEGCNGRAQQIIWAPDAKFSWPCSKGIATMHGLDIIGSTKPGAEDRVLEWSNNHP